MRRTFHHFHDTPVKDSRIIKIRDLYLKENDLKLIDDTLIASIIRNNEVIIPNGFSRIQLNDTVLVITKENSIDVIEEILR